MHNTYFLYAEDVHNNQDVLRDVKKNHSRPADIVCVANGFDLLQYLQQVEKDAPYPCLIILDLNLPRLGGMETLQLLKTDDLYRIIPVIVFASQASLKSQSACRALGAELVRKPKSHADWDRVLHYLSDYVDD